MEGSFFYFFLAVREEKRERHTQRQRERERERERESSNFSLRSTEIGWSEFVGPRMKVHLLDEGYAWVLKTRDFAKDLSKEFGKSKVLSLGSVYETS